VELANSRKRISEVEYGKKRNRVARAALKYRVARFAIKRGRDRMFRNPALQFEADCDRAQPRKRSCAMRMPSLGIDLISYVTRKKKRIKERKIFKKKEREREKGITY